ncbi:IS21 family transposase [Streptomyces sp. NBC_01508]|uniref:IS21 family transposase n=1 Tax=Streptomyces sp. NBC_01508 TaxID=2903888 RepID=UPI002F916C6B
MSGGRVLQRVELFELIRRDRRLEDASVRSLAKRYGVHRRVVRQAFDSALPPARKAIEVRRSVLEQGKGWIDEMLRADLTAPRKQRHTNKRIMERLRDEYGFPVAYTTLNDYLRVRRPQIREEAERSRMLTEGMVPQFHRPGEEAEVDFAEVWVRVDGKPMACQLFTLRLSYSGKAVHRVFSTSGQEAFMQGHVDAFRILGGIPTRHIRYDNLKPAVSQVCFGRSRVESQRWVAFRSHYGFDAFYCRPGIEGAHEKGGVEHEGGRFRRSHLVPVPEVDTLAELNEKIEQIEIAEDVRHVDNRPTSVGFDFDYEAPLMAPLPFEEFDIGLTLTPKVDKTSRITVRQNKYSVPARFIGTNVRVSLRADEVWVFERNELVVRHPRLAGRYGFRDLLDHYLEILRHKPGALEHSTGLAAARESGKFTETHDAFWAAARESRGRSEGTRALIEVLLLHRRLPDEAVVAGMKAVLEAGSISPDLVAIEARKALAAAGGPPPVVIARQATAGTVAAEPDTAEPTEPEPESAQVISLPQRRPALPPDSRPEPSLAAYGQLLSIQPKGSA